MSKPRRQLSHQWLVVVLLAWGTALSQAASVAAGWATSLLGRALAVSGVFLLASVIGLISTALPIFKKKAVTLSVTCYMLHSTHR